MSFNNSVCNVTLGNFDLSHIVNGFLGDPIEKHPFENCFTCDNIIKWWCVAGFMPMTLNSRNNPKVKWEAGVGRAPKEARKKMELLLKDYQKGVQQIKEKIEYKQSRAEALSGNLGT